MEDRYIETINESEKLWNEEYDPKAKDENCFCHEQSFKWGFQEGVDWADKHPKRYSQGELCDIQEEMMRQRDRRLIEKVCNWLEQTDFDMEYWNSEEGFCKEMFINDVRKVMED